LVFERGYSLSFFGETMQINVKIDVDKATRYLNVVNKDQIPFAASKTLNDLAFNLSQKVLPQKTRETFEGGATPFTQKGFRYKRSSKRDLIATVFIDPVRAEYMKFMVQGGTRFPKRKAILVSTKQSKLNQYGNIPRGTMQQMINDKKKFFKGIPDGKTGEQYEGIWERYGRQSKDGGQRIRMVAKYTGRAQYKPKFPMGTFTEGVVFSRADGFQAKFLANLQRAMTSAK
jgi:hypothetical protein